MAVLLGSIKSDKAYLEYFIKGKKKRIFFSSTPKALKFRNQLKRSIKNGVYKEEITNIRIKSMI